MAFSCSKLGTDLKEQQEAVRKQVSLYHSDETKVFKCLKQLLKSVKKKRLKGKKINDDVKFNLTIPVFPLRLCSRDTGLQSSMTDPQVRNG